MCGGERGVSTGTLSNSACGEGATPEALPVQAAETGYCWKAPCLGFPEASVASGTKDKARKQGVNTFKC